MIELRDYLVRQPDIINDCGEETWRVRGTNLSLVRLQYKARSDRRTQLLTKEWYFILRGRPTMIIDEEVLDLHIGMMVVVIPGQIHQIVNHVHEDVLFMVEKNIKWDKDQKPL